MLETRTEAIDRLTGGAAAELKAGRPKVWAALEASQEALLGASAIPDVSPAERQLVALAIAVWHGDAVAADFYAGAAAAAGAGSAAIGSARAGEAAGPRLAGMLAHARLLTFAPAEATPADLAALRAAGISEDGIISLAQLIAYISHQLRAAHLLRVIGG
ncbi:MAG: hypothetical protein DI556_14335 [Rhodovulum sulfidophilum]|uniref:CMD domain protein n=1 Tax=Rhodovulum sulfidophilum TaxID=35806 RepID=A0A2W5PU84_RHOSU|nr:MAG: hypothetical protein DI556_14335 [Rhodovulum sulfidophilum]